MNADETNADADKTHAHADEMNAGGANVEVVKRIGPHATRGRVVMVFSQTVRVLGHSVIGSLDASRRRIIPKPAGACETICRVR